MTEADKVAIAEAILANQVFTMYESGDRKKRPTPIRVRFMTEQEVRALAQGETVVFVLQNGKLGRLRITSIKTWKTRPDVMFGVRRGLRDTAALSLQEMLARCVVVMSNS